MSDRIAQEGLVGLGCEEADLADPERRIHVLHRSQLEEAGGPYQNRDQVQVGNMSNRSRQVVVYMQQCVGKMAMPILDLERLVYPGRWTGHSAFPERSAL